MKGELGEFFFFFFLKKKQKQKQRRLGRTDEINVITKYYKKVEIILEKKKK